MGTSYQYYVEKSIEPKTQVITLDIICRQEEIHALLGHAYGEPIGISSRLEELCSNLLMAMENSGMVKDRKQVQWYELVESAGPLKIELVSFSEDNGTSLEGARWKPLDLKDCPFNLERYKDLFTINSYDAKKNKPVSNFIDENYTRH